MTTNRYIDMCLLMILGAAALMLGPGRAQGAETPGRERASRAFNFPNGAPGGALYTRPKGAEPHTPWKAIGPAQGQVVAPADVDLRLLLYPERGGAAALLEAFAPGDLAELDCSRSAIGDELMPAIGRLGSLRFLELESTRVTDAGLAALANLRDLEGLSIRNCPVRGPGLKALVGLKKLIRLRFCVTKKTDDDVLRYLDGMTQLESLDILELDTTGDNHIFMMNMPELPNLKELDLSERANLKDEDLACLKRLPNLERLRFFRTGLKGSGLQFLAPLKKLDTLILESTPISGATLGHLVALPSLRHLVLRCSMVSDASLADLGLLKGLKTLDLTATPITDEGLEHLAGMTGLERLNVTGTGVSDAGLAALLKKLPGLKGLVCQADYVSKRDRLPVDPKRAKIKVGIMLSWVKGVKWTSYFKHRWGGLLMADLGFDLYGIVDPGTQDEENLANILHQWGVGTRLIQGNDVAALSKLDVIAMWQNYELNEETVKGVTAAVRGGVGLFTVAAAGGRMHPPQGRNAALKAMLGLGDVRYVWHGNFMPFECTVKREHPILGGLKPGDSVGIDTVDGYAGACDGEALLAGPPDVESDYSPLIVRQLGKGRCVHYQSFDFSRRDLVSTPREFCYYRRDWLIDMWAHALEWTAQTRPDGN